MYTLGELRQIIKDRINQLEFNQPPHQLYDPINYTLRLGGKRLRPALCLLACDMVDGDVKDALDPAIGIELFHNFTLLHDDIMDEAPIRRGKETVYKKWNSNVAILSGDTMMALSYDYVMMAPANVRTEVFLSFNKTAIEVCEGQQFDMNFEVSDNVSISDYLEMIRLKTAVLLAASLKIGATIGGADEIITKQLYQFGENIGIAFQLKDDLLDVFSDVEKFGKTTGGDIISNKKTFLYLKAFELADEATFLLLTSLFEDKKLDLAEKIEKVKEIYNLLNIRTVTEDKISEYYNKALDALSNVNVSEQSKKELLEFANQLKSREF